MKGNVVRFILSLHRLIVWMMQLHRQGVDSRVDGSMPLVWLLLPVSVNHSARPQQLAICKPIRNHCVSLYYISETKILWLYTVYTYGRMMFMQWIVRSSASYLVAIERSCLLQAAAVDWAWDTC